MGVGGGMGETPAAPSRCTKQMKGAIVHVFDKGTETPCAAPSLTHSPLIRAGVLGTQRRNGCCKEKDCYCRCRGVSCAKEVANCCSGAEEVSFSSPSWECKAVGLAAGAPAFRVSLCGTKTNCRPSCRSR